MFERFQVTSRLGAVLCVALTAAAFGCTGGSSGVGGYYVSTDFDAADGASGVTPTDAGATSGDAENSGDSGDSAGSASSDAAAAGCGDGPACATGQYCKGGGCVDQLCEPGKKQCVSKSPYGFEICAADGGAWSTEICSGVSEVCQSGECVTAQCPPGQQYCDGTKVIKCNNDGLEKTLVADCADLKQTCEAGKCIAPLCVPKATQCDGVLLQTCNDAGTAFKSTNCPVGSVCVDGQCGQDGCVPNSKKCKGAVLQVCNSDGKAYSDITCPSGFTCDVDHCAVAAGTCKKPTIWSTSAQVVNALQVPTNTVGACDLNGDGAADNNLGVGLKSFAAQSQTSIDNAIASGVNAMVMHVPTGWNTNGTSFVLELFTGDVSPPKSCSPKTTAGCSIALASTAYDSKSSASSCPASSSFATAKSTFGLLVAKSSGSEKVVFSLPLLTLVIPLALQKVTITGSVTSASSWQTTSSGEVCGAVAKTDIDKAIDAVSDEELTKLGFDKATVKALVAGVLAADVDLDGDGTKDAVSAYLKFTTTAAKIVSAL